jgi:hypothetical protein
MQAAKKARFSQSLAMKAISIGYQRQVPASVRVQVLLHDTPRLPPCAKLCLLVQDLRAAGYAGFNTYLWWSPCTDKPMVLLGYPGEKDAIVMPYTTRRLEEKEAEWYSQMAYAEWYKFARPGSWSPSYTDEPEEVETRYPAPDITAPLPPRPADWPRVMAPVMTLHQILFEDGETRTVHFFPNDGVYTVEVSRGGAAVPEFAVYAMAVGYEVPNTLFKYTAHHTRTGAGCEAEFSGDCVVCENE